MFEFHPYPKWKYHPEKAPVIVESSDEEESLGTGWCNSPAEYAAFSSDKKTNPRTIKQKKVAGAK